MIMKGRLLKDMDEIATALRNARTILIIGLSRDSRKDSNVVARALSKRYEVLAVNPAGDVSGFKTFTSIKEASGKLDKVDIVNIFRPSDETPDIVYEIIKSGIMPKVIWMQEGIKNNMAAKMAREHGIDVVMDRCIYKVARDNNLV